MESRSHCSWKREGEVSSPTSSSHLCQHWIQTETSGSCNIQSCLENLPGQRSHRLIGPLLLCQTGHTVVVFFFFHIRISPFSDYNRCCFTHNQTQSDFLSIRYVKLKKRIHNLVSFIKALVGHSTELWSLSHLGMGLGTLGKSGLSFCSLQVKFRTLDHKSLTEDYLDMGCMQITLHSGSFKKLLLQRANKEKGLT